jgi:hypothetical protein
MKSSANYPQGLAADPTYPAQSLDRSKVSNVELVPDDAPIYVSSMQTSMFRRNMRLVWKQYLLAHAHPKGRGERLFLTVDDFFTSNDIVMMMMLQAQRCWENIQQERELVRVQ